jgi:hypothetical protein
MTIHDTREYFDFVNRPYFKNTVFRKLDLFPFSGDGVGDNYFVRFVKLRSFSPQANYTDRETVACRRS